MQIVTTILSLIACGLALESAFDSAYGAETRGDAAGASAVDHWRRVDESWCHVGWGGFSVEGDSLRTDCDPKGLGLLVYKKVRFGNCQVRVVFKCKDAKSNAGVIVRMADGILDQVKQPGAAFDRDSAGKISAASMKEMRKDRGTPSIAATKSRSWMPTTKCTGPGPFTRWRLPHRFQPRLPSSGKQ
jgi:hypothetical protein